MLHWLRDFQTVTGAKDVACLSQVDKETSVLLCLPPWSCCCGVGVSGCAPRPRVMARL